MCGVCVCCFRVPSWLVKSRKGSQRDATHFMEKSKGKPQRSHSFCGQVERAATKKPLVLESHGSFWSFGGREIEAEIKPVSMGSFGEVFLARPGRRAMGETHGQRVSSASIVSMAVGFLGLGFSGPFQ